MTGMLMLLQIIFLGIPLLFVMFILSSPDSLYDFMRGAIGDRERNGVFQELAEQAEFERTGRVAQAPLDPVQAEIERKVRIAEEAQAARARGETYVPPADYDR
jgi:hypothetical protein